MNRRHFILNFCIAFIVYVFSSFIPKRKEEDIVSCAPEMTHLTGTVTSAQDGDWNNPATWTGNAVPTAADTPVINHNVKLNISITTQGLNINSGGKLEFDPLSSIQISTNKNIVNQGTLKCYPLVYTNTHKILFTGINEAAFVGTAIAGNGVVDSDVGLWVTGAGKLDFYGAEKKSWTFLASDANIGDTSVTVKDATGWHVGDEIVIVVMDRPLTAAEGGYYLDWDDATQKPTDTFNLRNERCIITAISGNTLSFTAQLLYNHYAVDSTISSEIGTSHYKFEVEVANLTRNVQISGEDDKHRAHIFYMSSTAPFIKNAAARWMGPRNVQTYAEGVNTNTPRPQIVLGRYAWHFHHCMDGSIGGIVEGCVAFDCGGRAYVPHDSHGITFNQNVSFDTMEEAFWYDFYTQSHFLIVTNNLFIAARNNGVNRGNTGIIIGQGDQNSFIGNHVVYCSAYELHSNTGAANWGGDNEGVALPFKNTVIHSCLTGLLSWQNTSNNHTIEQVYILNCVEGISHGAYINSYQYKGGHLKNTKILATATSGNKLGVAFTDYFIDAGGERYGVIINDSPVPSNVYETSKLINCTLTGHTIAGVQISTPKKDDNAEKQFKIVDLIDCAITGTEAKLLEGNSNTGTIEGDYTNFNLKSGNMIRVQRRDGTAYQLTKDTGVNTPITIAPFAATLWGSGEGLKGEYWNGTDFFGTPAVTRLDTMIMFQQWSLNAAASPNQVHHLIVGDNTGYAFCARWTGFVQAQFTNPHTFRFYAGGMVRFWLNGVELFDNWSTGANSNDAVDSSAMNLVRGEYYSVLIEHKHPATTSGRGCIWQWKSADMPAFAEVPVMQLFTEIPPTSCNCNCE